MTKKIYDLVVQNGNYPKRDGTTGTHYVNIGSMMEKDDGKRFLLIDRSFNPAGIVNPDNKSSILVSMFTPKDKGDGAPSGYQEPNAEA